MIGFFFYLRSHSSRFGGNVTVVFFPHFCFQTFLFFFFLKILTLNLMSSDYINLLSYHYLPPKLLFWVCQLFYFIAQWQCLITMLIFMIDNWDSYKSDHFNTLASISTVSSALSYPSHQPHVMNIHLWNMASLNWDDLCQIRTEFPPKVIVMWSSSLNLYWLHITMVFCLYWTKWNRLIKHI